MKIVQTEIHITTTKQFQLFPITKQVQQVIASAGLTSGICVAYTPDSTAGIRINSSESLLHQQIMKAIYRIAPVDIAYGHGDLEVKSGSLDKKSSGHAHVKAFLLGTSETIPIEDSSLALGPHQHIYFVEFDGARERRILLTVMGE